jgi:glycosyltransferase involved in cell wall biosynthesis
MRSPDLAVVIPLHNKAAHIAATIDSALGQTLPVSEIIVVDDASSDGGAEIAAQYVSDRVRLLRRDTPGAGGYAARNLAIGETKAEWIAFLDADDVWKPQHIENLMRLALPCGELVGCAFAAFENDFGTHTRPQPVAPLFLSTPQPLDFATFLRGWLSMRYCPIRTSASAFRRDVLMRAGLFPDGRTSRGGDKDLWLRALRLAPAVFSPERTMLFNCVADNKVSDATSTAKVPLICDTIAQMLAGAPPREIAALLERLHNQELRLYARFAFGRARITPEMKRALRLPLGWRDWLVLSAMQATPPAIAAGIRNAKSGPS